jgi:hypothetical protein
MTEQASTETNTVIYNPKRMADEGVNGELFEAKYVEYSEVERETKDGRKFISKSHRFVDDDGKNIIVNSAGLLDYLIKKKNVAAGSTVKVLYFGKDEKGMHSFDVISA